MRLLLPLVLFLVACAGPQSRDGGFIMTHDGRWVRETAEVARDEFAFRLARKAEGAAGAGWQARIVVQELPTLDAVQADTWGWKTSLTIALTLVPPATAAPDAKVTERVESEVLSVAVYQAAGQRVIHLTSTLLKAGEPPAGSTRYVTVAGDTFAGISTAFYGSPQHWRVIADANPTVDQTLPVGTTLVIPPKP